jgi:hypothetical protein
VAAVFKRRPNTLSSRTAYVTKIPRDSAERIDSRARRFDGKPRWSLHTQARDGHGIFRVRRKASRRWGCEKEEAKQSAGTHTAEWTFATIGPSLLSMTEIGVAMDCLARRSVWPLVSPSVHVVWQMDWDAELLLAVRTDNRHQFLLQTMWLEGSLFPVPARGISRRRSMLHLRQCHRARVYLRTPSAPQVNQGAAATTLCCLPRSRSCRETSPPRRSRSTVFGALPHVQSVAAAAVDSDDAANCTHVDSPSKTPG